MSRKTELNSIIDKARQELWEVEKKERLTKNQKYIGNFYKYHNCYSCPNKNKYWWYYVCVTGIDKEGELVSWGFQKDIHGKIDIELEDAAYSPLNGGYVKISGAEFYKAYISIIKDLQDKTV